MPSAAARDVPTVIKPIEPPVSADKPVGHVQREPERPAPQIKKKEPTKSAVNDRLDAVERLMRSKGLLAGDDSKLDEERRRASVLAEQGNVQEARATVERAMQQCVRIKIDRKFADAKLTRLNQQFDRVRDPAVRARVEPIMGKVLESISQGDFRGANKELNRCFELLR